MNAKRQTQTMNQRGKNIEERAYVFALTVVKTSRSFPKNSEGFTVATQIIRSATSIPANLIEGSAAVSKKEFINFLAIAKKSAIETKFWLRFSSDLNLISRNDFEMLADECEQIIKIISAIILKTNSRR